MARDQSYIEKVSAIVPSPQIIDVSWDSHAGAEFNNGEGTRPSLFSHICIFATEINLPSWTIGQLGAVSVGNDMRVAATCFTIET